MFAEIMTKVSQLWFSNSSEG